MRTIDFNRHPCFNAKVKGQYGRVHLPVAPKCNIQCNYCNRKYDCVNESRPGVTSTVLSPDQALYYMGKVLEKEPRISVAGIAGPGDPFANAEETLETMRLIRKNYPDTILCLASNGMNMAPHVEELAEIGVSHITVTVNGVDPAVTEKVYSWVRDGKVLYRGRQGAELLLARQLSSIEKLKQHGITVKINTILIPGVNDHHIIDVAKTMKKLGADLFNCMAMFPNADTVFEDIPEPSKATMNATRNEAEKYLPQMRHCTRCRADAVGLLDDDKTDEMRGCLSACASLPRHAEAKRPYVAVATQEGVLVNQHLGEATRFQIWGQNAQGGYALIEERQAPAPGGGAQRWLNISRILSDCQAILVNDLGDGPKEALSKRGLKPVAMSGFIEKGLEAVYSGKGLSALQGRMRKCSSKGECLGTGTGCG
ncbi:MAG: nitrogenase cofactor biosynthesis protein NifB [Candidatus Electrothrix sp. YB6]